MRVSTVGLDLAKDVFQVHGVSDDGTVVFNRAIRRAKLLEFFAALPPCLVGMEACGSAHHWGRELGRLGHDVRLMPAFYVKPYVKRGKTDAVDAAAICEAVARPTMRFVAIKTPEQQAILGLHRTRDLVVRQRTQVINMLRGLLREFGHVFPKGPEAALRFAKAHLGGTHPANTPEFANSLIATLCDQLLALHDRIKFYAQLIETHSKKDECAWRLRSIPGVGPVTASAIAATIGDGTQFKSGREFAAWLGLTPLNRSSGGKERLGKITKKGDSYIRRLLVIGMTSRLKRARQDPDTLDPWARRLLERKPARLATVAMANKTARIIWAVLTRGTDYRRAAA
ncbi:MAG: IS110 family transposase [Pseudomonadota bacterium]